MGTIAKWIAPASCAALVVAGCGGEDSEEKAYIPAQPGPGDERVPTQENVQIDMEDIAFNPRLVAVRQGGTITWTNRDRVAHNVTKRNGAGPQFVSRELAPRKTYMRRFDTPGQISYLCTIHANMTGTIRVEE